MKAWLNQVIAKAMSHLGLKGGWKRIAQSLESTEKDLDRVWQEVQEWPLNEETVKIACEIMANPMVGDKTWAEIARNAKAISLTKVALKELWKENMQKTEWKGSAINYGFLFLETFGEDRWIQDHWKELAQEAQCIGPEHLWYRWIMRDEYGMSAVGIKASEWVSEPSGGNRADWWSGFLTESVPWLIRRQTLKEMMTFEGLKKVPGLPERILRTSQEAWRRQDKEISEKCQDLLGQIEPVLFLEWWLEKPELEREILDKKWLGGLLVHPDRERRARLIYLVGQVREWQIGQLTAA